MERTAAQPSPAAPHSLELSSHCPPAGTAGSHPRPVPAEVDSAEQEGCGAAQAEQVGTRMEILMGGR